MNRLALCSEGSLDLWAFPDPAQVCIERLVHGKVAVTLEGDSFMPSVTRIIQLAESTVGPNAEMAAVPTRSKCQNARFAYIQQSDSRGVSEGFDDAIVRTREDARSPALDTTTVSHFALASCHSLRGTDLVDIIPGLKLLKEQNSLLGFCTLQFYLQAPKQFRNFLNTMTFRHDQRWKGRGCQGRADGILCLCCVQSAVPTVAGFGWCTHVAPRHILPWHPGQNDESHHLELWEFEQQLFQDPTTQHC
ncbi:hypothetical protein mRhiFer1_010194 [Rhinolophus ferrumequinum]|uniref:Uncharacterized protein n=1 Tax=Rhinolophus ferrumequinum TaxID=59479 RepID=A0A7J7XQ79_RHIFE|nr:hypothetical protein mRhiFer1_010194 [Rhinolophus ferrumequinum]